MLCNPLLALEFEASLLKAEIESYIVNPVKVELMIDRLTRITELAALIRNPVKPVLVVSR